MMDVPLFSAVPDPLALTFIHGYTRRSLSLSCQVHVHTPRIHQSLKCSAHHRYLIQAFTPLSGSALKSQQIKTALGWSVCVYLTAIWGLIY